MESSEVSNSMDGVEVAFKRFRPRRGEGYYDPFEPAVTKSKPPTPRSDEIEGTAIYSDVESVEEYQSKLESFSEILASIDKGPEKDEEVEDKEEGLEESKLETYSPLSSRKMLESESILIWDLEYNEYLLGLRVMGEPVGAWIQGEANPFNNIPSEPFYIPFGFIYEHSAMIEYNALNPDSVKEVPAPSMIDDLASLKKFLREGQEGEIIFLRFRGSAIPYQG